MLSHVHRCVFVHVPKTGGTSIELALTGHDWIVDGPADHAIYLREQPHYRPDWGGELCAREPGYFARRMAIKHASQDELAAQDPRAWSAYLRFTFVRDPWERVLAVHRHARRDAPERTPASFGEWLAEPEPTDHMGLAVFAPLVTDWDAFDFVGRFERLEADFADLALRLGAPGLRLPHVSHGSRPVDYRRHYDAASRWLVAERCAEELERFGYEYGVLPARRPAA